MAPKHNIGWFPFWSYLKQPLFSSSTKAVLIPWQFRRLHRIHFLENCWHKQCGSKDLNVNPGED